MSTWSGMEIICLFVCDLFVSTLFISTWNRDVVGTACIRNKEQKVLTKENEIKEVWKDYYENLLNEEFEWDHESLEIADHVIGPNVCDQISVVEVRSALASSKSGKAAGPSGVIVEMLEASGEAGL